MFTDHFLFQHHCCSTPQIYMNPLRELAQSSAPILDSEQINTLFGTVADIAHHHELFYSALLSRTLDWHVKQKIGDIFMSSVSPVFDEPHPHFMKHFCAAQVVT